MNLTDESKNFHHGVYTVVLLIPYGHVTSYGKFSFVDQTATLRRCDLIQVKNWQTVEQY